MACWTAQNGLQTTSGRFRLPPPSVATSPHLPKDRLRGPPMSLTWPLSGTLTHDRTTDFSGDRMIASLCRIAATLAILGIPVAAVAQGVPGSALPGRERQQFETPQAPRAQPRGSVIALPSTVAPAGAESIKLTIRGIRITGSTVYSDADLEPLYADLLDREVPLQAVYDLAQRITARYGRDGYVLSRAIVPPQNLSAHGAVIRLQVIEGYIDRVIWPDSLSRYRNFFTDYEARIVSDRPTNIRTLERYLLLLSDLPGFKVATSLRPSTTQLAASTLVVEVTHKPLDVGGRVDNHGSIARGPGEFLASATVNNILGAHEAFTATYAGAVELRELQLGPARHARAGIAPVQDAERLRRGGLVLSDDTIARTQPDAHRARLHERRQRDHLRRPGDAAEHARPPARRPRQGRRRLGRPVQGHQSGQRDLQPGHRGARQHRQQQSARLARQRPRRLQQDRGDLRADAAAVLELLGVRLRLRAARVHGAAHAGAVRLRRPLLRARLRSLAARRRQLPEDRKST